MLTYYVEVFFCFRLLETSQEMKADTDDAILSGDMSHIFFVM